MTRPKRKRKGARRRRGLNQEAWGEFYRNSVLQSGGRELAVLRPADPTLSKAETKRIRRAEQKGEIDADEASRQFDAILHKQEFRFMGLMTNQPDVLLDPRTRQPIKGASVQSWDSFVPFDQLSLAKKPEPENP